MYRSCIFCSSRLGGNEVLEAFPVGRSVAFDHWKGRLWAICPRCRRWNLAPLEERWEAVEEAEEEFRRCRLRAHSENVGVAKMRDGTRLIRVGKAVPLELATWRYGAALTRRHRRMAIGATASIVAGTAVLVGGIPFVALGAVPAAAATVGSHLLGNFLLLREAMKPVVRVPAAESPTGKELVVRQQQSYQARIVEGSEGTGLAVELPSVLPPVRREEGRVVRWVPPPPMRLEGDLARRFLERSLVRANAWSSGRAGLAHALGRLDSVGGPAALLRSIGQEGAGIFPPWLSSNRSLGAPDPGGAWRRFVGSFRGERIGGFAPPLVRRTLPREDKLALEIALAEETERRALEGELAALEAAWREAEEIAAIADTLPDDPLDSLDRS
jgi:hypothetical protein